MNKLISIMVLLAFPAFAGDLTTGHEFTVNELVTHNSLNASVNDAELKANAVGTTEIANSAVTVAKLAGIKSIVGGRLTLTTLTPLTSANVASSSTLYYTPHHHNEIALFDGAKWSIKTFSERSTGVAPAANTNYDVFLYDSAGTLTLDLLAWTNSGLAITAATTASPIVITANGHGLANGDEVYINGVVGNTAANGTWIVSGVTTNTFALTGSTGAGTYTSGGWLNGRKPLTRQDGVLVKGTDVTRRYLGTIRTITGGQFSDANSTRYVWNYYNREKRQFLAFDTTDTWTYSGGSYQEARAQSTLGVSRVAVVFGLPAMADAITISAVSSSVIFATAAGIGLDSSAINSGINYPSESTTTLSIMTAKFTDYVPPGMHTLRRLERGAGSGTQNWFGDRGMSDCLGGLIGWIDA